MRWGVSFSPEEGVEEARKEEDEVQQVVICGCPQQAFLQRQPWLAQAKRIRRMRIKGDTDVTREPQDMQR